MLLPKVEAILPVSKMTKLTRYYILSLQSMIPGELPWKVGMDVRRYSVESETRLPSAKLVVFYHLTTFSAPFSVRVCCCYYGCCCCFWINNGSEMRLHLSGFAISYWVDWLANFIVMRAINLSRSAPTHFSKISLPGQCFRLPQMSFC